MDYIFNGSLKIPSGYYVFAVMLGMLCVLLYLLRNKIKDITVDRKTVFRSIALGLLAAYLFLVFSTTVFARPTYARPHYNLMPFWSYVSIYHGSRSLLTEDLSNVVMLMPVGVLMPLIWQTRLKRTVFYGFLISFTIELLQLVFRKGLWEFDDLFHNTLGVLIGYGISKIFQKLCQKKY